MDQSGGQYPQVPSVGDGSYASPQPNNPDAYQPALISQPQPNSFDMVGVPLAAPFPQLVPQAQYPAQQEDPTVAPDTRPDWQQQIYSELNQGADAQLPYTSQQAAPSSSPVEQPLPAPYTPTQPLGPSSHFQISYESATGEPVANPQTSVAKKALIITLGILIPFAVLGGVSFAAYSAGKNAGYTLGVEETKKSLADQGDVDTNQNADQDTDVNDEAALNFELVQPEYKDEVASGMVGEQLQLSDGMVVLVKSVDQNFQPTNSSYQQDSGRQLIKVNLLIGNADSTQPKTITNQTFGLREPSGAIITADTEVGEYEGLISTLPVSPGGKARMSVVFSVETGATPLVLVREQAYNLRSQGVVVNMNIEVDLGL